jgi:STE24 endopeptidase
MYFVVIMAFALVLSEDLPPSRCLLPCFQPAAGQTYGHGLPLPATLAVVAVQLVLVTLAAVLTNRATLANLGTTLESHEKAVASYARGQRVILGIIAVSLPVTIVFTPWAPLVRDVWGLGRIPLIGDLLVLTPFAAALLISWCIAYRVESRIKHLALDSTASETQPLPAEQHREAAAALAAAKRRAPQPERSLGTFLADKLRHQVLIVGGPMCFIVLARYFTSLLRADLRRITTLPWAADSLLGLISIVVLVFAPVLLRYVWITEPLPAGALRDRFARTCLRIGLRYREILLWHTHGTAVNAAVMGFIPPLRYILVSDALLETMAEDEIEAVFGHEAGHVRHRHLQFFILFAIVSMYISGGLMYLLWFVSLHGGPLFLRDDSILQLIALTALLATWLFGFGWVSRRFERQADLFGVRCLTPDIACNLQWCPVHGKSNDRNHDSSQPAAIGYGSRLPGVCITAANVFGRTLTRIADLNGIPKDAASWRHGSIEDRCKLVERLATDQAALRRFENGIFRLKAGLILATLVGTVVAGWLYGNQILHAIHAILTR